MQAEPFNTGVEYFSKEELAHIEDFVANQPETGNIYEVKGEARKCIRVTYPTGTVTPQTEFGVLQENKTRNYHTPCAKITDSREARIIYTVDDGEQKVVSSSKWLKWARGAKVTKPVEKKTTEAEKAKIKAAVNMMAKSKPFLNDKHSEGANWQSLTNEEKP